MRLWLSGPRLLHGLVRPGISLGKEDFRPARKAPAMVAEATLVDQVAYRFLSKRSLELVFRNLA
jgi:hypothetical protein